MHIYLIRHGQSYVNLPDWKNDDWDLPLTELGEQQSALLGQWLAEKMKVNQIYCSDLKRTLQTAQLISELTGVTITPEPRIREVGANGPDGKPISGLNPYNIGVSSTNRVADPITQNGENWMQFRARLGSFVHQLIQNFGQEATQNILVVCHGGVIRGLMQEVFGNGFVGAVSILSDNTGVTHLQYRPLDDRPKWRLHYHNRIDHLPAELIAEWRHDE